jgi:hypothetical protein
MLGLFLFVIAVAGSGVILWQGQLVARIAALILPWCIGALIILPLAIYLRGPIHVLETSTHWITLGGVSGDFVSAWKARALNMDRALAARADVPRFEVFPFRPDGVCPWPGTLYFLLGMTLGGILAGLGIGWSANELADLTRGWGQNDVRYVYVLAGLLFLQGLLFFAVLVPLRRLHLAVAVFVIPVALIVALLAWAASFLGYRLSGTTAFCLYAVPVFLGFVLINRQVQLRKVRSGAVAGSAGTTALASCLLGMWLTTHGTAPYWREAALSYLFAGGIAFWFCWRQARQPFCTPCDCWMERTVLGSLSHSSEHCMEVLKRGEIVRLATATVHETGDAGDVELSVYRCPVCGGRGELVLQAAAVINKKKQRSSLGSLVYPPMAWPILEELFPKLRADETVRETPEKNAREDDRRSSG